MRFMFPSSLAAPGRAFYCRLPSAGVGRAFSGERGVARGRARGAVRIVGFSEMGAPRARLGECGREARESRDNCRHDRASLNFACAGLPTLPERSVTNVPNFVNIRMNVPKKCFARKGRRGEGRGGEADRSSTTSETRHSKLGPSALCHSRESGNPVPPHARPSLDARFRGHDTELSESSPHIERLTRLADIAALGELPAARLICPGSEQALDAPAQTCAQRHCP